MLFEFVSVPNYTLLAGDQGDARTQTGLALLLRESFAGGKFFGSGKTFRWPPNMHSLESASPNLQCNLEANLMAEFGGRIWFLPLNS